MGMQMGIRCRSLGKILKQILRAYHRQLCENVGLGFVNMWTYIKGSCIIYVIIMKVFGSRPKLVIIGKFCELTHFLSWWQRGVFKESGFGVTLIRMSGSTIYCLWALLVSYSLASVSESSKWNSHMCPAGIAWEFSESLSAVSLTRM